MKPMNPLNFRRFNLANLIYTLLVIGWGAYVRASGSGAGCGAHWPLCNGEILPVSHGLQTVIEFLHRITSGLSLVLVVFGFLWAFKIGQKNSPIRKAALLTVIAIFLEAAIGAGLVLLRLVEFDQSAARAISISLHLVNTLFLLATLTTLTWKSFDSKSYEAQTGFKLFPRDPFFLTTLSIFVALGIAGAVTALGDTLFPTQTLTQGMQQDLATGAHFLLKLRVIHPILATLWVMLAFGWSRKLERPELLSVRALFLLAVTTQFVLGFVNWMLMAPVPLQLVHLLVADLVFISFWLSALRYEKVNS
jgi:cytochrome c oxidase assembly protein subunit 15